MNDQVYPANESAPAAQKRPYSAPRLVLYGGVADLTGHQGSCNFDDGQGNGVCVDGGNMVDIPMYMQN